MDEQLKIARQLLLKSAKVLWDVAGQTEEREMLPPMMCLAGKKRYERKPTQAAKEAQAILDEIRANGELLQFKFFLPRE